MGDTGQGAGGRWSEATFRALTDSCGDIVSLLDAQGRLVFNSSAAARISGFSRDELADVDTFTFIHPDDREATQSAFQHVLAAPGNMVTVQYRYRHKSGAWTWMEAVATNHLHDPAVRGVVAVSRDITARKAAEEELRREAERKSTFLAELSHELRTPLAAVRTSIQILARTSALDENAQRALASLERQSAHLTRLTDDLLDSRRMEDGKIRFDPSVIDLAAILRETLDDLGSSLAAHRVVIDVPEAPVLVKGDRVRLAQVASNLLENARRFTPDRGTISVVLKSVDGEARLDVADDGEGIDASDVETVFLPFVQSQHTLRQSSAGLGLGLALVRGIVELHGGTVRVESAGRGLGSRFAIRIPLSAEEPARAPETPAQKRPLDAASTSTSTSTSRTILVIDDQPDAADCLRILLGLTGHRVEAVYSGADGVSRARALIPDVVLCDIGLRDMDGYAVARALRSEPATASVKLIALSGYVRPEDQRRAREAGFDVHVAKPADLRLLEELIAGPPADPAP